MSEETAAPVESAEPAETDDTEILETEEPETEPESEPEEDSEPEKEASPQKPKPSAKEKAEEKPEPEKKEPPKRPKKVLRGKVDGEETDIELEPEEVDALRAKQMTIAAQRRLQEVAEERKRLESIQAKLKNDPFAALKEAGLDVDALVEKYVLDFVQKQQMTPEQREAAELRAKLAEIEGTKKREQEEAEKADYEAEKQRLMAQMDKEFAEGAKAANLPPSPRNIGRMAEIMRAANEHGYDMDPEEAAQRVREDLMAEHSHLFGSLDGEELLTALGKETVEKVRKTLIAKAKAKPRSEARSVEPVSQPRDPKTQRFTSVSQMLRALPQEYRR